jgi:hypothetical protein
VKVPVQAGPGNRTGRRWASHPVEVTGWTRCEPEASPSRELWQQVHRKSLKKSW